MNPSILQSIEGVGPNPPTTSPQSYAKAFASNTTTGSAIIAFPTLSDYAGIHTDLAVTDSQGNSYTALDQVNTSRTGGAQSLATFLAVNTAGGADTVTQSVTNTGDNEDYRATFLVEVTNVNASPLVGHNGQAQNALAPGTNNLVSGNIAVSSAQVPCILVGLGFNTTLNGTHPTPTVGTGMTQVANCFGFSVLTNGACVAYQVITTAGTYQAVFNQASSASEDCACVAVILQGSAGAASALAGAAADVTSAAADLTTSVVMLGAATDATTAVGALTNYASVVLAGTLYTGTGGILDPNFWVDNVPQVGDTIWYDPTYITIYPNGEISSTSNNCSAFVWFNDGTGPASGIVVITPNLVGYASDLTIASGTLTTGAASAQLSGAGLDVTIAAAALTTQIKLIGAAFDAATAAAGLTTAIQVAGTAADATSATGNLTAPGKLLAGTATDTTTALAALSTAIQLAGAAVDHASAAGVLTGGGAQLAGSATSNSTAAAVLSTQIKLKAAAADISTALAALTTKINLAGAATDTSTAHGASVGHPQLSGTASDTSTATGALLTVTSLAAAAIDVTLASGTLFGAINLYANAVSGSIASADLGSVILITRIPNLIIT